VYPGDWVRCELQARPKDEAGKRAAAAASPEQVWTFTAWAHEFAKDAMALDLERFYHRAHKYTSNEKTIRWMCHQYGNAMGVMHEELGDWACVGLQLGDLIAQIAAEEKAAGV
jgi:hypothetical protein